MAIRGNSTVAAIVVGAGSEPKTWNVKLRESGRVVTDLPEDQIKLPRGIFSIWPGRPVNVIIKPEGSLR